MSAAGMERHGMWFEAFCVATIDMESAYNVYKTCEYRTPK